MIVAQNVLVSEGGLAAKEHDPVEAGRHDVKNGENFHLVDEAILRVDHRRLSWPLTGSEQDTFLAFFDEFAVHEDGDCD